ncbi:F-box domain-containing protein [Mycena sanguinolenta]|uniref:F-box domain-containing protein n=1 Tax=Mycena sanguinolenta TaxID=230812 RepID=A0A8H7D285_9AGAR|nr:F-box domain-containing protein [Mycena sanguinolenta]
MSTKDGFPEPELKSRIRDLLRSHSPPPHTVSSTISVLADELDRHDHEIARLKGELRQLESRRSALAAYRRDCRGLLAPIRRLPSEILFEIFQLCRPSRSEPDFSRSPDQTYCAMAHLAQDTILQVSQVCILWHTLVMGTPTLWNIISLHAAAVQGTPRQYESTLELLRLALQRSGSSRLSVQFHSFGGHVRRYAPALELIARHSARWRSAKFRCSPHDFEYLSGAKGNLPLLSTLELDTGHATSADLNFLQLVPSLKNFIVHGPVDPSVSGLLAGGLTTYKCVVVQSTSIASAVASISRLPRSCAVCVELNLLHWIPSDSPTLGISRTSANITSLSFEVSGLHRTAYGLQIFDEIFAAITLPSLHTLSFTTKGSPPLWPHRRFMQLSIRSSFSGHLDCLNLVGVHITEPELVECLSTLPALRQLSLMDRYPKPVVNNALLTALTRTSGDSTCLVPHLRILECISDLRFDDSVYLGFLISRCQPGDSNHIPLVSRMRCSMDYHRRPVDSSVAARIQDMCAQRVLVFGWLS